MGVRGFGSTKLDKNFFGPAPVVKSGKRKGQVKQFVGIAVEAQMQYRVDPRMMLGKRNLNRHMRVTNKKTLLYWHKTIKPIHFTAKGHRKYGYQVRSRATMVRKRKRYGHNLPIRASGTTESMTDIVRSVRGTPRRGTLTMLGPWYLGHRVKRRDRKGKGQIFQGKLSPDLKDELTRVDKVDAMKMAHYGGKLMREAWQQDKRNRLGAKTIKGI